MNDQTQIANPFAVWTALAARASELMWPSEQAIGLGTARGLMNYPEHGNSDNRGLKHRHSENRAPEERDRDNRELALIARERLQAGAESLAAIMSYPAKLNMEVAAAALRQWIALSNFMWPFPNRRPVMQSDGQQAKAMHVPAIEAPQVPIQSGDSTARVARHGPKRTHSRGVKNGTRRRKR